jgi:hypothetical protein
VKTIFRLIFAFALVTFAFSTYALALPACPTPSCSTVVGYCVARHCGYGAHLIGQCDDGGTTRDYYLIGCGFECDFQVQCTMR